MQENKSSSLLDIISRFHSRAKQAQTGRDSFLFFYRMPNTTTADACIVFSYKGIK